MHVCGRLELGYKKIRKRKFRENWGIEISLNSRGIELCQVLFVISYKCL